MSVQVENLEKSLAKLTIEVDADTVEKSLDKVYQKQKKNLLPLSIILGVCLNGRQNTF